MIFLGRTVGQLSLVSISENSTVDDSAEIEVAAGGELTFEPQHNKINKMICEASKGTDQPRYPPNQISLRCPPKESFGPWLTIKGTVKTLIKLDGYLGWSESSSLSCSGSFAVFKHHDCL